MLNKINLGKKNENTRKIEKEKERKVISGVQELKEAAMNDLWCPWHGSIVAAIASSHPSTLNGFLAAWH